MPCFVGGVSTRVYVSWGTMSLDQSDPFTDWSPKLGSGGVLSPTPWDDEAPSLDALESSFGKFVEDAAPMADYDPELANEPSLRAFTCGVFS
jgi:hypothetical protein